MQNPDKSTAHMECWNDLGDEKSTESHNKPIETLEECGPHCTAAVSHK